MITGSTCYRTVHIVGGGHQYKEMFTGQGWWAVDCVEDADLVQFTGGADVSPNLYGEQPHPTTYFEPDRDEYEKKIFDLAVEYELPIAGICRGGQFVHVMNGGKLYQDVDCHGIMGEHLMFYGLPDYVEPIYPTKIEGDAGCVFVSSTHHQMMVGDVGLVLGWARRSRRKETFNGPVVLPQESLDVEAVYHHGTNSLSYQPHPEFFHKDHPCQLWYFHMIKELLFKGE